MSRFALLLLLLPGLVSQTGCRDSRRQNTAPADRTTSLRSADQLWQAALEAERLRNLDEARRNLKLLVETDPDYIAALYRLAVITERKAILMALEGQRKQANPFFLEAGRYLRQYLKVSDASPMDAPKQTPNIFYNEACGLAYAGQTNEALDALQEAIDYGYVHVDEAQADPDFNSIKQTDRFQKMMAELQQRQEN